MYPKLLPLLVLSLLMVTPCFGQERSKKHLKEEFSVEKQKQIEKMINAKEFVFIGRHTAEILQKSIINLGPHYVKFHPDLIESSLPFYSEVFVGAVYYGSNTGLNFAVKPDKFTVKKERKNYQINVDIKTNGDYFNLSLTVYLDGNATLIFSSSNRRTITYNGEISALKE